MYYSVPGDKVLVMPWDFSVFEKVPPGNTVVIEALNTGISEEDAVKASVFFKDREINVMSLVLKFADFKSFLASHLSNLTQDCDVVVTNPGTKREFMPLLPKLAGENFRFVLPLHSDSDRLTIKILSSSGVRLMIDMRDPLLDWAMLDDLVTDQLLSTAPRAPLEPIAMLAKVYKTKEFDISTLYHAGPADFMYYDPQRGLFNNIPRETFEAGINEKLIKAEKCAFCEGFVLCGAFLEKYNKGNYDNCSGFFGSLYDSIEINAAKEEKAAAKKI